MAPHHTSRYDALVVLCATWRIGVACASRRPCPWIAGAMPSARIFLIHPAIWRNQRRDEELRWRDARHSVPCQSSDQQRHAPAISMRSQLRAMPYATRQPSCAMPGAAHQLCSATAVESYFN
ncbi:hypothetical protein HAX54_016955 [Datura stramonium]|uniref:Secreted protein n=1 Tax=Datura stramonium TaxID=4076 RepID=A0ABS8UM22_DATST|nr:hypothetical protein [Datura stramonium]